MTNPKKNGDLMLRVRYDSGAELAGPAVITDEGALLVSLGGAASMLVQRADGSLPPHITFVDIRPSHVGYGLPLTDDMAYMAVTAMLRDAVGLPLNEAADRYESWLNRVRRAAIEKWVDSLSMRESTQLHVKYLDLDGAGHPKEEGDAWRCSSMRRASACRACGSIRNAPAPGGEASWRAWSADIRRYCSSASRTAWRTASGDNARP